MDGQGYLRQIHHHLLLHRPQTTLNYHHSCFLLLFHLLLSRPLLFCLLQLLSTSEVLVHSLLKRIDSWSCPATSKVLVKTTKSRICTATYGQTTLISLCSKRPSSKGTRLTLPLSNGEILLFSDVTLCLPEELPSSSVLRALLNRSSLRPLLTSATLLSLPAGRVAPT